MCITVFNITITKKAKRKNRKKNLSYIKYYNYEQKKDYAIIYSKNQE